MPPKIDLMQAIEIAELSDITKKVYKDRLRKWQEETNHDLAWILKNPVKCLNIFEEMHRDASKQTRKSYIAAVLALYRYNAKFKTKNKKDYDLWFAAFQDSHKAIEEDYRNNVASDKQHKGFIAFPEIVKRRDDLKKGSLDRLLLSMYTYIPPLRADFNRVQLVASPTEKVTEPNFLQLYEPMTLVLQEFKTKKKQSRYEKQLPDELCSEIKLHLKLDNTTEKKTIKEKDKIALPKQHLFEDRDNKAYTAHGFTQFVNRSLMRLFGKPLTISLLRHSYINSLDFNTITIREREEIAELMTHSVGMQDRYRLLFKQVAEGPEIQKKGQNTVCDCKCGPQGSDVEDNAQP